MMPTAAEEGMYMPRTRSLSRRQFIARTVAAAASGPLIATSASAQDRPAAPPALARKVKLGVVGLGGRGRWIAGLFRRHGGYDIHAVADYFPQVAQEQGLPLASIRRDGSGQPMDRVYPGLRSRKPQRH